MINAFVLFDSVFDENGEFVSYRFVFINEAYETITGVKNEAVQGKTVHEVWPETEPDWIKKYGEVAVTGVPQTFEMYHSPTNKLYHCNVYRPWDSPDRFCVIFDDITERKEIEAELQHARKMESIGVLAGGVAHDFNNILGIVLGNAELALDDVPEWNPAYDFLKEIRSATLRAKDVVQELLRFSRKSTEQKKPLEVCRLVKESMKTLRATIPSSVDFSLDIPERLHYIHADPTQIHQILMNLVSNAADAMEGGGILGVTLENVALEKGDSKANLEPGRYIKLSVKDTGAGIETEDLNRIFDPYFTTKDIGKGTGMGLAVIYGIVQRHDGGIRVDTEIGKGTTFELYFPVIDAKPEHLEKSVRDISGGKESILFVDDEESMVNLNRQRLERLGYDVTGMTNPVDALDLFRQDPEAFDLIITDMTMPKMTGDKLVREIFEIRPDVPIILCTGYSEKISKENAQEIGIRKYIEKPIEKETLARSVREVLDGE
jgi:PAS domain S-box-containing protein